MNLLTIYIDNKNEVNISINNEYLKNIFSFEKNNHRFTRKHSEFPTDIRKGWKYNTTNVFNRCVKISSYIKYKKIVVFFDK